ncbi:hypothetical protein CSUI_001698 [Cystoisospora suis]|uniref:Uncharacterized protein n=1 Tax=Cystoisospora suis TaxID=483139 RepID=A0A2C6LAU1_9APIC|nr:hypothetical protein CSUI_001698 [Cystoisospora suis]
MSGVHTPSPPPPPPPPPLPSSSLHSHQQENVSAPHSTSLPSSPGGNPSQSFSPRLPNVHPFKDSVASPEKASFSTSFLASPELGLHSSLPRDGEASLSSSSSTDMSSREKRHHGGTDRNREREEEEEQEGEEEEGVGGMKRELKIQVAEFLLKRRFQSAVRLASEALQQTGISRQEILQWVTVKIFALLAVKDGVGIANTIESLPYPLSSSYWKSGSSPSSEESRKPFVEKSFSSRDILQQRSSSSSSSSTSMIPFCLRLLLACAPSVCTPQSPGALDSMYSILNFTQRELDRYCHPSRCSCPPCKNPRGLRHRSPSTSSPTLPSFLRNALRTSLLSNPPCKPTPRPTCSSSSPPAGVSSQFSSSLFLGDCPVSSSTPSEHSLLRECDKRPLSSPSPEVSMQTTNATSSLSAREEQCSSSSPSSASTFQSTRLNEKGEKGNGETTEERKNGVVTDGAQQQEEEEEKEKHKREEEERKMALHALWLERLTTVSFLTAEVLVARGYPQVNTPSELSHSSSFSSPFTSYPLPY